MTQEATPVGGEAATPAADPKEYFDQLAAEVQEDEPAVEEAAQADPETAEDELELEEEADDLPPIDAPVSWDAEAKAKFAELPRDTQEYLAKREGERERFVQQKSQEAARARTEAEQAAIQQLAQIEHGYARHYQQIAEQIMPQRPNPALLQHDPMAFYAQQAQYESAAAQQRELQQLASQHAEQAQQREAAAEQARMADEHRIIVENYPEYADPTRGPELQRKLTAVAKEMGYPDELISQARANDILAMRTAAEWKAKADKFDALQAKRMEKVRAAKGLPRVAKPGVSQGADQLRSNRANAAFDRAKNAKSLNDRGEGFYDFLKNTGQI